MPIQFTASFYDYELGCEKSDFMLQYGRII